MPLSPVRIRLVSQSSRHVEKRPSTRTKMIVFTLLVALILILSQPSNYTHAQPSPGPHEQQQQSEPQIDQHTEPERILPQMFEVIVNTTPHQRLNSPFIDSSPSPMSTSTTPSVSIQAERPPPKYLFPGIVDLGPPAPNTLNFGILLPLNFPLQNEEHWRSIVTGGISVSESLDLWKGSMQRRPG